MEEPTTSSSGSSATVIVNNHQPPDLKGDTNTSSSTITTGFMPQQIAQQQQHMQPMMLQQQPGQQQPSGGAAPGPHGQPPPGMYHPSYGPPPGGFYYAAPPHPNGGLAPPPPGTFQAPPPPHYYYDQQQQYHYQYAPHPHHPHPHQPPPHPQMAYVNGGMYMNAPHMGMMPVQMQPMPPHMLQQQQQPQPQAQPQPHNTDPSAISTPIKMSNGPSSPPGGGKGGKGSSAKKPKGEKSASAKKKNQQQQQQSTPVNGTNGTSSSSDESRQISQEIAGGADDSNSKSSPSKKTPKAKAAKKPKETVNSKKKGGAAAPATTGATGEENDSQSNNNDQGKYVEALSSYNKSLEIYKKMLPSSHSSTATILNNIGLLNDKQESLQLFYQTLLPNHPSIISAKHSIGLIYFKQEKYEDALDFLNDESLKEECRNKMREQKINKDFNPGNEKKRQYEDNSSMKHIKVLTRQVKCDDISTEWIIINKDNSNSNFLIGKVLDDRYKIEKFLGEGGFGKVYTVKDQNDGQTKVIKFIKINNNEWFEEAKSLSDYHHKNVVKYEDHFELRTKESMRHPCILTEYCQNGDLAQEIQKIKARNGVFLDKIIANWMYQAADGLLYLHNKGVIHRDIKPANILLSQDNVIKLADLGGAKAMKQIMSGNISHFGSDAYSSPEMCDQKIYSGKTDIWSLGCVFYELVFLKLACLNLGKDHPHGGSMLFSGLIRKMLMRKPEERITTEDLYIALKKLHEHLA